MEQEMEMPSSREWLRAPWPPQGTGQYSTKGLGSGQGHEATVGVWAEGVTKETKGSAARGRDHAEMQRHRQRVRSFIFL